MLADAGKERKETGGLETGGEASRIQITSWLEEGVATPPAPPEIDWEIQVQYSKHILQLNNIISHGLLLHKYKIFNELLPLALPSPIQRWISSNLLNWIQ